MNGKKLITILMCVMLIGTLLPSGVLADEGTKVKTESAVSADEAESSTPLPETAVKSDEKQTAEAEKAVPVKPDEKKAASDDPGKTALAESDKKEVPENVSQNGSESEPGADLSEKKAAGEEREASMDAGSVSETSGKEQDKKDSADAAVPAAESEQSEPEPAGQDSEDTRPEAVKPAGELTDEKLSEAEELQYPAFSQSRIVSGVVVTVSAPAGVFPEDAVLSVAAVPGAKTEAAIENEREADANVVSSYTFDIKVLDPAGSEIQPAGGQTVIVSFTLAEVADANLDTQVYHISGGSAKALDVTTAGQTATAETTGFSLYTVEFTYGDLQYVLRGGESVALSVILEAVGLTGEPSAAVSSAPDLFSAEKQDGVWTVVSRRAFQSEESLEVMIGGTEYVIKVTDDGSDGSSGYGLINGIPAADGGYVWMGGESPVKWQVIGKNESNWLLIASDLIGGNSNYMNWNDAKNICGTVLSGFSEAEQAAVPTTTKSEPEDYQYESNYGYYFGPSAVNAKMFLLSAEEAETYFSSDAARHPGWWWLRSPALDIVFDAGAVHGDGLVYIRNVYYDPLFGARPAFQLNLSSVLFSSAAEGGKSSAAAGSGEFGTIKKASGEAGNEIKLTLIDSSRSGFSASAASDTVSPGETLEVSYSGVTSGDTVSALICDASGEILYYASKTPDASGTWNMTIPADLAEGNYTLKVFSEQQNVAKKTDYASAPESISLKVAEKYTVTVEQGSTKDSPAAQGDTVNIKADEPEEGMVFAGWTSEDVVFADASLAETSFEMPGKDVTVKATYKEKPQLTITAVDQTYLYTGKDQGPGDTAYEDPAEIAEMISIDGLQEGDAITSIIVDGQASDVGEHTDALVPSGATVNGKPASDSYKVTYVNGKITIDPNVNVKPGSHMTAGEGTGELSQGVKNGEDMTPVVFTADEGYYFPEDYSAGPVNGISVTRDTEKQITVAGTLTGGEAEITLPDAVKEPVPAYTVTYKVANGTWADGTTEDKTESVESGNKPASVPTGMVAAEGFTGGAWDTDPGTAAITGDTTFTYSFEAIPSPAKKGTLTFDLAGGTLEGKTGKITIEANVGDTIKLPDTPTREGYTFQYWKGSRYEAGADYKVEGDHTFTAVWEKNKAKTYTVTFNANGHGTAPASQTVEEGKKATKPKDPTASGYTFGGWYTDKECKSAYSFDTAVTKDITLYAKWTKSGSSSGKNNGSSSATSGKTGAKTGDNSQIGFWLMMMAASLTGLVVTAMRRRKFRR